MEASGYGWPICEFHVGYHGDLEPRFGNCQRTHSHNPAPFGFTPMEPRFDNYWAAILDTATIEAILRKQSTNAISHFTLDRDELSNQRFTGVNGLWI